MYCVQVCGAGVMRALCDGLSSAGRPECRARLLVDILVFVRSITVMSPGLLMVELAHLSRVKASLTAHALRLWRMRS